MHKKLIKKEQGQI